MAGLARVERTDVERVLARVEQTLGPDEANLLRDYLTMLEGQVRIYQLEGDAAEDLVQWAGALE